MVGNIKLRRKKKRKFQRNIHYPYENLLSHYFVVDTHLKYEQQKHSVRIMCIKLPHVIKAHDILTRALFVVHCYMHLFNL